MPKGKSDGDLTIKVSTDTADVYKNIKDLDKRINSLSLSYDKINKKISETTNKLNVIDNQIEEIIYGLKQMYSTFYKSPDKSLLASADEAYEIKIKENKEIQKLRQQQELLNAKLEQEKQTQQEIKTKIEQATQEKAKQVELSQKAKRNASELGSETERTTRSTKKELSNIQKAVDRIGRGIKSIVLYKIIYGTIAKLKEGFQNLARYSDSFNQTLSNMKSASTQMGNSIATMLMPVLQALEPLILKVIKGITNLAETITMYTTAMFTNNTTYVRAKEVALNYADSLGQVSKAQNKVLANFDEINQLSSPSSAGGSGGLRPQDMFETVPIPADVITKASDLKKNLQEIEGWLITIGGALLAIKIAYETLKIMDWIRSLTLASSAINLLNGNMLNKNRTLKEQTRRTLLDGKSLLILAGALFGAGVGVKSLNEAMEKNTQINFEPNAEPVVTFREQLDEEVKKINEALEKLDKGYEGSESTVETATQNMQENSTISTEVMTQNVETLTSANRQELNGWQEHTLAVATEVFGLFGDNSKSGLEAVHDNMAKFIFSSAFNLANWGNKVSENMKTTGQNIAQSLGSALQKAWDDFVGFMKGIGEAITNWWTGSTSWIAPTLTLLSFLPMPAAIPLKGASTLMKGAKLIPGLATGTVVPAHYGEFLATLGDNKREPEIVSPYSTMKQAMLDALQESGQNITIGFEETDMGDFVRKLKPYFARESRRTGNTTRRGGVYNGAI